MAAQCSGTKPSASSLRSPAARITRCKQGGGCIGDTTADPLGATFGQVYNGSFFYVLWNDQFYGDPLKDKDAPRGHSKGMLAWNNNGTGMVLQVSTPSWPASGSAMEPRKTDGNTLGCVADNDVLVSQHFFALALSKDDVVAVLKALAERERGHRPYPTSDCE